MAGRDYSLVRPTFWTGETGRNLRSMGRDAQLVSVYLITCGSCNMIGLYYLPIPLLCHEIGMSREGALKGLQRASEALFAHYDAISELVYVPEMAAHQVGDTLSPKDNRHKSVVKLWNEMSKSRFYMDFYDRYAVAYNLPEPKPLGSPLEAPSETLRSQEQEQEQEQDIEEKERQASACTKKKSPRISMPPAVEEVACYCQQRGNGIDPESFVDHYQRQGWSLNNGRPMKDWQAAVRLWEKHDRQPAKAVSRVATEEDLANWRP